MDAGIPHCLAASAIAKKARAEVKRGPFPRQWRAPSHSIVHAAQTGCRARRELPLRSLPTHSTLTTLVSTHTHTGPGQSPDLKCSANTANVHQTPRGAANTERNAYARRGQTAAARRRPVERARPRGAGHVATGASARGGPARNRCGRHEQCERDRGARAVRSRRVPRATRS